MDFKLSFLPQKTVRPITHQTPILLTGSCFSEHMASLLQHYYFDVTAQPNGVIFNPVSIAQHLLRAIKNEPYREEELFLHNELWHTWHHHGSFSGTAKQATLDAMNAKLAQAHRQLKKEGCVVMVTWGSGFVYERKDGNEVVANCHKYPQHVFNKRLLQVSEVMTAWKEVMQQLPEAQFFFTVSPVRHLRDGLVENNRSKAVLLQAVHELCDLFSNSYYFPAYEIVIDELRDYRFYNSDMTHPNEQAITYVWERLVEACMDDKTRAIVSEAALLNTMLRHKILHEDTEAHRKFEETKNKKITELEMRYGITIRKH